MEGGHLRECCKTFKIGWKHAFIGKNPDGSLNVASCSEPSSIVYVENQPIEMPCTSSIRQISCGPENKLYCRAHYEKFCERKGFNPNFSYCANQRAKQLGLDADRMSDFHPYELLIELGCSTQPIYRHTTRAYVKKWEGLEDPEYLPEESESEESDDMSEAPSTIDLRSVQRVPSTDSFLLESPFIPRPNDDDLPLAEVMRRMRNNRN